MKYQYNEYNVDTKVWSKRGFKNKRQVIDYVRNNFKHPGKYGLKDTYVWKEPANTFLKYNEYTDFAENSIDFRKHWDFEKEKSEYDSFLIFKSDKQDYEFVVPSLYYFYLNYCPIYLKSIKNVSFIEIWDGDLHTFMAILLCILEGKHFVCLKKRQFGMSFKLTSILTNIIWFSKSAKAKMFSYNITHTENSWLFLEQYRDHINKHCGWKRGFDPNKFLDWQVRRRNRDGTYVGNMSIMKGLSTERDASKPVGGGITFAFGEEAGINPNLDVTHGYLLPAVSMGGTTTGTAMYAGSVGELDKCEPLKKFMFKPVENGFLDFPNVCPGDEQLGMSVGFFVPEWWNYKYVNPETLETENCYDEDGNSDKDKALVLIEEDRDKAKHRDADDYKQYLSQRPLSITEAFAYRRESLFPQDILAKQEYRILKKELYPFDLYDIKRDEKGKPVLIEAKHIPIEKFPFRPKKGVIPYGAIKIWHKPEEKPPFYRFFAAVDPISVDKTNTSESLFSVVIYEALSYEDEEDEIIDAETGRPIKTINQKLTGDRIVASYIGRKETTEKTNEVAELLIEYYNAFAIVENNVDKFIQHMIKNKKQQYMALKDDLPFLKELNGNLTSFRDYGVYTNPRMWIQYKNKILDFLKESLGEVKKPDGTVVRIRRGVERIPDIRLIRELQNFTDEKGNYDQIITLGLVIMLVKVYENNGIIATKKSKESNTSSKNKNKYESKKSAFNINRKRNPFKFIK